MRIPSYGIAIALTVCLAVIPSPNAEGGSHAVVDQSAGVQTGGQDVWPAPVPFITLRNRTGSDRPMRHFGDERDRLRSGYCDLERTPVKFLKLLADKASFYVPEARLTVDAIREVPVEELWNGMGKATGGHGVVLYSHGYNIGFGKACRRASLFQKRLGLEGRFVLFSWPSHGTVLNYTRDEADLYWSVAPLTAVLTEAVERFGTGRIDLVGHSLGTRGIFLALTLLGQQKRGDAPLVDQVVLVAPDIDAGIFAQHLPAIRPLARRITVYVSANDSPLVVSRELHGHPRLGEAGPHLDNLEGLEVIDVTDIGVRYPSGHVYHLYHSDVADDLSELLIDGKSAAQRSRTEQIGENRWRLQP